MKGNMSKFFISRTRCPSCGSANLSELKRVPLVNSTIKSFIDSYYGTRIPEAVLEDIDFLVEECLHCGLLFQKNVLTDQYLSELYDKWIPEDDSFNKKRQADLGLYKSYAREAENIANYFSGKKPYEIDVLDFGMGWGFWSLMVKAFGYNSYGFELSESRRNYAQRMGIEVISDIESLMARQFDYINMEQVLEHVAEPQILLKMLSDRLKDGGVLKVAVPNGEGMKKNLADAQWQASKDPLHPLEHINCFNYRSLRSLGEQVGLEYIPEFKIIKSRFIPGRERKQEIKGTRLTFRKNKNSRK